MHSTPVLSHFPCIQISFTIVSPLLHSIFFSSPSVHWASSHSFNSVVVHIPNSSSGSNFIHSTTPHNDWMQSFESLQVSVSLMQIGGSGHPISSSPLKMTLPVHSIGGCSSQIEQSLGQYVGPQSAVAMHSSSFSLHTITEGEQILSPSSHILFPQLGPIVSLASSFT